MTPPVLDAETFDDFVSSNEIAVVGFIGAGGGDAENFSAAATQVMAVRSDAAFAMVGSNSDELFGMFGLRESATAIFRERVVVYLEPGIPASEHMNLLLQRVAALDIARVHAEIEQERATRAALATHRVCPTARRGKFPP